MRARSTTAKRLRRQRKACRRGLKRKYATRAVCEAVLADAARRRGVDVAQLGASVYQCAACEWWHIARGDGDNYAMVPLEAPVPMEAEMGDVIRLDDYRDEPAVTINTGTKVHVYPLAYFEALIRGEDVDDLPPDALRAIVGDWLADLRAELAQ